AEDRGSRAARRATTPAARSPRHALTRRVVALRLTTTEWAGDRRLRGQRTPAPFAPDSVVLDATRHALPSRIPHCLRPTDAETGHSAETPCRSSDVAAAVA